MVNPEFTKKALYILSGIWAILLAPSVLLVVLAKTQHLTFGSAAPFIQNVLLYNTILFPIMIIISVTATLLFLKKEHYHAAFVTALLPFINILIELIVADLALMLI